MLAPSLVTKIRVLKKKALGVKRNRLGGSNSYRDGVLISEVSEEARDWRDNN